MEKRILNIVRAILFLIMIVALVFFMVMQLKSGVETLSDKLFMSLYIALIVWGLIRLVSVFRKLFGN